jgi:hypothetical protein
MLMTSIGPPFALADGSPSSSVDFELSQDIFGSCLCELAKAFVQAI